MKKLLLTSLLMLSSLSLNAVEIINNSSMPFDLTNFNIKGREIMTCEALILQPGQKYQDDLDSCTIYFSAQKYELKDLKVNTVITCEMVNDKFIVRKIDIIEPVFEPVFVGDINTTILKSEK